MKFWQSLAFVELEQMPELAKFCEELGFYGVSYGDHLVTTKEQADDYLYQKSGNILWNPETHWPDIWVMTAALAQATSTLKFLSSVYILPMRDPYSAAKAVGTCAYLSGNRVVLGVGVGWQKAEFTMLGHDFHTRGKRADEQLEIIKQLTTGDMVSFDGKYYQHPALQMSPGLTEALPIWVGGYSDAAMRRAANHDGWMAVSHTEDEIYPLLKKLEDIRKQAGSGDKPFDIWTGVKSPAQDTHKRLADAGVTMVNGTHFFDDHGKLAKLSLDEKKKRIEVFAEKFIR